MRPSFFFGWLGFAAVTAGCSFSTERFVAGGPDVVLGADVVGADVVGADVVGADVVGADVVGADVVGADVVGADVVGADVVGADVVGADVVEDAALQGDATATKDAPSSDAPQPIFCATTRPCPTGLVCDDGVCQTACPSGQLACAGFCRATASSPDHCGACDNACSAGQECQSGACVTVCAAPTTNCGGVCTDLSSNNLHCGRCGERCTGGAACVNGVCACPSGQTACSSTCVDLSSDRAHCGRCGSVCASGQVCAAGTCVVTCTAGLTNCGGACVNLSTSASNCGRCGSACAAPTGGSVACSAGSCVQACPSRQTNCNGACVDLSSDRSNCGRCGTVCDLRLQSCSAGVCCSRFTTNCGGTCTVLSSDNNNCGACGRVCSTAQTCRSGVCENNFRIASLSTTALRNLDHMNIVGDDRGGIAANVNYVYYSGDSSTGRGSASDLSAFVSVATPPLDGIFSNLSDGRVYSLSLDGATAFNQSATGTNFTHIVELSQASLAVTTNRIALSTPIPRVAGRWGVFAGFDRLVLYNGARAYNIALPSGVVTDLGAVPLTMPQGCESWAFWGVAEFHTNAIWLVYRQTPSLGTASAIVRTRVPDGLTQTVASFSNISDLCSFTVVPGRGRWYWHHEYTSQLSTNVSSEWLGFASATFSSAR